MSDALPEGAVLDRYRIIEPLGAGGMGEVYRAFDQSLERSVAIKILPARLVSNPDRVRRFAQEAKAASGLNHPNIVTIYEIGEATPAVEGDASSTAEPVQYIAMELVDGETLRRRIYVERPGLRDLLRFLAQTAEGLSKAHAAGIVHRDLKPDNVMITRDGYAKVLDFGLAKLVERGAGVEAKTHAPTEVKEQTHEGAVMGTVGYMAPEQVHGGKVDHRADIFSFGCILYETIARRKPFLAESSIDTMHKIIHDDPPSLRDLAPDVPSELRRMVRRCLAKDPERRYQSMKDLAIEIADLVEEFDELSAGSDSDSLSSPGLQWRGSPRSKPARIGLGIALLLVAVVSGATAMKFLGGRDPSPLSTMSLRPLTANGEIAGAAVSPDGRYLAFLRFERGNLTGYLKQMATGSEVVIMPPSETLSEARFTFSSDGEYLYVMLSERGDTSNRLVVMPSLGGTQRPILSGIDSAVALSPDQKELAFVRISPGESHLMIAAADGTGERAVASRQGLEFFPDVTPSWSPDGKWIAAAAGTSEGGLQQTVMLHSPDGKESRPLPEASWFSFNSIRWLPDGSGVVVSGQPAEGPSDQIYVISSDDGTWRRVTNDLNSYRALSMTSDGRSLVTVQVDSRARIWKISGEEAVAVTPGGDRWVVPEFRPLPDGSVVYPTLISGNLDIWRHFPSGERRQLTTHAKADYAPSPHPDGSRIYFQTERSGDAEVWSMTPDGGDQRFLAKIGFDTDLQVSPDGRWLLYGGQGALWRVPTSGGDPVRLIDAPGVDSYRYSPDGKSIVAYFRLHPPPDPPRLGIIPAEGGDPREIAELPSNAIRENLAWLPDGSGVAFRTMSDGVVNFRVQPLDGGPTYPLTNFDSGFAIRLETSSDGALYVSRSSMMTDAVMITDFR